MVEKGVLVAGLDWVAEKISDAFSDFPLRVVALCVDIGWEW